MPVRVRSLGSAPHVCTLAGRVLALIGRGASCQQHMETIAVCVSAHASSSLISAEVSCALKSCSVVLIC